MKIITTIALGLISLQSMAQVTDTVALGSGYANQAWYSLENDEMANNTKSDWDIAFESTPMGYSVNINHSTGTRVWMFPGDTSQWSTLDTTGINGWTENFNADTSWSYGAFSQIQSGFDVGWGTYNMITHFITGDKLFVISLSDGSYKKVWIKSLQNSTYTFRYADLDNTSDVTDEIIKGDYFGKNFAYYSIQNETAFDKEPLSSDWDLFFGQYVASDIGNYLVSGVLTNFGTQVAQAYPINDITTYTDYSAETFESHINVIGYDWKSFNMSTFQYDIQDSLVYFIETQTGDIWKVIFTGFGGSANGYFIFDKELIAAVGIEEEVPMILNVYPNPAVDIINITCTGNLLNAKLFDVTGKCVQNILLNEGLNTHQMYTNGLMSGLYILQVGNQSGKVESKKIYIR